jgi:WD40-like Beta Propeller Repeat
LNKQARVLVCALSLGSASFFCKEETAAQNHTEARLHQPQMIGEGTVSTSYDEFGGSMTSDGREIYFCRSVPPHYFYTMYVSRFEKGRWSNPDVLPFSGRWRDSDPVLSPDGQQLFFVSDRVVDGKDSHTFRAYVSRRSQGGGWGEPALLPEPINQPEQFNVYFISMARNANLYFTRFPAVGGGNSDVYVSRFVHGHYVTPENLGANINVPGAFTVEAFIAPDESYLLLGGWRPSGGYGSSDIWISYNQNGQWTKPVNVGPPVNTSAREYSPRLTPDGKWLIFTSERGFPSEHHAKPLSYDEIENRTHGTLNGLGNIYRIDMNSILQSTRPPTKSREW